MHASVCRTPRRFNARGVVAASPSWALRMLQCGWHPDPRGRPRVGDHRISRPLFCAAPSRPTIHCTARLLKLGSAPHTARPSAAPATGFLAHHVIIYALGDPIRICRSISFSEVWRESGVHLLTITAHDRLYLPFFSGSERLHDQAPAGTRHYRFHRVAVVYGVLCPRNPPWKSPRPFDDDAFDDSDLAPMKQSSSMMVGEACSGSMTRRSRRRRQCTFLPIWAQ